MPRQHASPFINGAKVRELRKEAGLSVRDLAAKIGISESYLGLIENGRRPTVAPRTFNIICKTMGVERHVLEVRKAKAATSRRAA